MNAVPPKGQLPPAGVGRSPTGEPVHLTMSFEDDLGDEAVLDPARPDLPQDLPAERAKRRAVAAEARPEPVGQDAGQTGAEQALEDQPEQLRPQPEWQDRRQPGQPGKKASPAGSASARGGLPAQFAQIELTLTVEVGSVSIALKELMSVEPGQLLALDRMTSEPVSVLVNGKPFARGEIVAVGDRYGVRLLEIVASSQRED
jgi:flagellar motor switch protein FliN